MHFQGKFQMGTKQINFVEPCCFPVGSLGEGKTANSYSWKCLVMDTFTRGTVRLRFRKSIARHNFQNTRKFENNYFQYHRDVIFSV